MRTVRPLSVQRIHQSTEESILKIQNVQHRSVEHLVEWDSRQEHELLEEISSPYSLR